MQYGNINRLFRITEFCVPVLYFKWIFSVFSRALSVKFFKNSRKIIDVVKSEVKGYFFNAHRRSPQKCAGMLQTNFRYGFRNAFAAALLKKSTNIRFGIGNRPGNIGTGYVVHIIVIDERKRITVYRLLVRNIERIPHTFVCGVSVENDRVTGVIVENKSGRGFIRAKVPENWVVRRAHFNFDVHNLTGASLDKTGIQKKWAQPEDYAIPYGCLLPKKINGLLLSGRNISGSHLAHSNYRIMSVCIALGEAAGAAAAISVNEGVEARDVDVKKIQSVVGE